MCWSCLSEGIDARLYQGTRNAMKYLSGRENAEGKLDFVVDSFSFKTVMNCVDQVCQT